MEGFLHDRMGSAFEKTNKLLLRIPNRCDKPFQSLVMDVFDLFVYKTFCTPHSGMGDFGSWNVIGNVSSSLVVFGVESDEAAATYFAGLDGYGDDSSQQFTSNSIFQPNDTEVETEPAELVRGRPGGHKVVETAASQLSVCNVVDELSMQEDGRNGT
ncbi:uncharacterized protein LOC117652628 [Thrips palmi]|uniref:Uncharacterized protein LOC117652628 n=1 Tax=Thrips palmi TaxID=161013 RepID=A0A6P9ACE8_THRPL|nr:uncharacterized protein LOC117652628 [Thrips palmi]